MSSAAPVPTPPSLALRTELRAESARSPSDRAATIATTPGRTTCATGVAKSSVKKMSDDSRFAIKPFKVFDRMVNLGNNWGHAPSGLYTRRFDQYHCLHHIAQRGRDAAGRVRRPRFCTNKASYVHWNGTQYDDALCKIHYRKQLDSGQ